MIIYFITITLIALSALFSGFTLGYFTLNLQTLRRQAKFGNEQAAKILPIRERGTQLLTTLLLGNISVNTILSVYLTSITDGLIAAVTATSLIFIFGEILPQAVLSRHAMRFGASVAPIVRLLMWISSPVTFPIAWTFDRLLGEEMPTIYSKHEIMDIVSEHGNSEHSQIDKDEVRIVHGALQFSHLRVREVMTPQESVVAYPLDTRLTDTFFEAINNEGYSRFPVYNTDPHDVVGILFAKDLIIEDEGVTIGETEEALQREYLKARPHELLDAVLGRMLKQRQHMAIIRDRQDNFVGVITLEDIIEEIIKQEIIDEEDAEDE